MATPFSKDSDAGANPDPDATENAFEEPARADPALPRPAEDASLEDRRVTPTGPKHAGP